MSKRKRKQNDDGESECPPCVENVAMGSYLRVCNMVGDRKKCKKLLERISNEEITPEELYEAVRRLVKKGSDGEKALDEIDKFVEEESS